MGLMDSVTGGIDSFMVGLGLAADRSYENDSFLIDGKLTKAKLKFFEKPDLSKELMLNGKGEIEFFLNPEQIQVTKSVAIEQAKDATPQKIESKPAGTNPITMDLGTVWFDTYDTRKNVRTEYIDTLEKTMDPHETTHHVPAVYFCWGNFSSESKMVDEYLFYVEQLDVTYSMFLPNGTPVRASVKIKLKQCNHKDVQVKKESPDHAKLYTIRRGDTLQGIAMAEYDDPREWRRIADSNSITDPLMLAPGTKLLIPPILR